MLPNGPYMTMTNPPVIDALGVDPVDGRAVLFLFVGGGWDEYAEMMSTVEVRMNQYIEFIISGQLAEQPQMSGRAARIEICSEAPPPNLGLLTFVRWRDHLKNLDIALRVCQGADRREIPLMALL